MKRNVWLMLVVGMVLAPSLGRAQATGLPSFNAPYRAFQQHEFGGTLSFSGFDNGTAVEGMYRFASQEFDIGLRGGVVFPDAAGADNQVVAGVEARYRTITHSESLPLDGAIVFGGGVGIDGGTSFQFPVGLSLGRRVDVENSEVSIVPYAQPTLFLVSRDAVGGRTTDLLFALGVGADFRLSRQFDARVSLGLGDVEGIAISAVWIR